MAEESQKKYEELLNGMQQFLYGSSEKAAGVTLISGLIESEYFENHSTHEMEEKSTIYIDKLNQACSMAFFGFSSQYSRALKSDTIGNRVNDNSTYSNVVKLLAERTDKFNTYKYSINDEKWLLGKLQELDTVVDESKRDEMLLQLPEVIITPSDVKFSPEVTSFLCKYDIPVQRVGKAKQEDSLSLGDAVHYDRFTTEQEIMQNLNFMNAVSQIDVLMGESKIIKQRRIQKRKIEKLESGTFELQSNEAIDYILNSVEDMYKNYDQTTYEHIQGMKKIIPTLDSGLSPDQKLSDAEKKRLEQMVVLHDIGKLVIPKGILASTNGLNADQRSIMNMHVMMENAALFDNDAINEILSYALNHHAGYDKNKIENSKTDSNSVTISNIGYGDSKISDHSNDRLVEMLHVLDVYNALSADRPYKKGMPHEQVVEIMKKDVEAGKMNPQYVQSLLAGVELENNVRKIA